LSGLPAEVGLNLPNSGSNTSLARRDGAEAAARRGLQLARRVVGVPRLPQFVEIIYCRKYVLRSATVAYALMFLIERR